MADQKKAVQKKAVQKLKAARKKLNAYHCDKPDAEYDRRNKAVINAEKQVPWWRR